MLTPLYYVMRKVNRDPARKAEAEGFLNWMYERSQGKGIAGSFGWWEQQWAEWKQGSS